MYITTSRKSKLYLKRFSKYLSNILPNIKYIPRGRSTISKLFNKSKYFGYKYFIISKSSNLEKRVLLNIYKLKSEEYFLDKILEIEILDLNHSMSFNKIRKYNSKIQDKSNFFYFLDASYKTKDSGFISVMESKGVDGNIEFSFMLDDKYLGIKFKLVNMIKYG